MLVGGSLGFSSGGGGNNLSSVVSSTCMDLDSTISASYTSGTTWKNMVAAPADGSSQTSYDFYLGSDSGAGGASDPVFTGSAGTTGAYWAFNGSQFFRLKAGTNPTLFNIMHRTSSGSPFWIAIALKTNTATSGFNAFGTESSAGSGNKGIVIQNSSGNIVLHASDALSTATSAGFSNTTDTILIVSCDPSLTTSNLRVWLNSRTKEQKNLTATSTSANADTIATFCDDFGDHGAIPSGWRIRTFAAGNALIDDATAVTIINALNTRHGLTYV